MIKRPLTEAEAKLHAEHRCICCGVKVESRRQRKDGESLYPLECLDCLHLREPREPGYYQAHGRGRAGIQHEFARRVGRGTAGTRGSAEEDE